MKLLSVNKAYRSNQRLWTLVLAGIQLSFATFGSFAQSYRLSNKQNFLVNKSGDYLIDALVPNGSSAAFVLTSNKKEIEGNKATMAVLSKDVVINNKLEIRSDHDWFIVDLTAGQKYQFDMKKASTSPNLDTFLTLRDRDGAQIAYNDDVSFNNLDSRLIYKAINSGRYFLDASSYHQYYSGDYSLGYKVI